jgi:glutamine synthetase
MAGPNFVLNAIVADALSDIAGALEAAKSPEQVAAAVQKLLQEYAREHKRIIFNGDNYTESWTKEAEKRGLSNIRNTVDSLKTIMDKENVDLLERHCVLSKAELHARTEILFENYAKTINVEARTMIDMARRQILPAAMKFAEKAAGARSAFASADAVCQTPERLLKVLGEGIDALDVATRKLDEATAKAAGMHPIEKRSESCRDQIVPAMVALRAAADRLETMVGAESWPLPTYAEMMYVR